MTYRPVTDVGLFAHPKVKYYGAFLNGSLERMRLPLGAQIQDPVLFVCGGKVREYPCAGFGPNDKTVDINPRLNPDYVMDVRHRLPKKRGGWRAMIVDSPWSKEQARNYGTEEQYPRPGPLLKLCLEHTRPGGRVGILHWLMPSPPKEVHGCRIKLVFALPMALYNKTWRGYVVFEKVVPRDGKQGPRFPGMRPGERGRTPT